MFLRFNLPLFFDNVNVIPLYRHRYHHSTVITSITNNVTVINPNTISTVL